MKSDSFCHGSTIWSPKFRNLCFPWKGTWVSKSEGIRNSTGYSAVMTSSSSGILFLVIWHGDPIALEELKNVVKYVYVRILTTYAKNRKIHKIPIIVTKSRTSDDSSKCDSLQSGQLRSFFHFYLNLSQFMIDSSWVSRLGLSLTVLFLAEVCTSQQILSTLQLNQGT